MNNNKLKKRIEFKFNKLYIVIGLLFLISVGFALITSHASFGGIASIQGKLKIYFNNLIVKDGSVTTDTPALITDDDKLAINFAATLSKPDDYYQFEVDIVNDSNSYAVLSHLTISDIPNELRNYVLYNVTYNGGKILREGSVVKGRGSIRVKVDVRFNDEVNIIDVIGKNSDYDNFTFPININLEFEGVAPSLLKQHMLDNVVGDTSTSWVVDTSLNLSNKNPAYYIASETESNPNPIYYYRGDVTNNNVIFADKCWKILRTTETGGIRLLYNGEDTDDQCLGTNNSIGPSAFNSSYNALNYIGYMYDNNSIYTFLTNDSAGGGLIFNKPKYGESVNYDGSNYKLNSTMNLGLWLSYYTKIDEHHYSCFDSNNTSCNPVHFVFRTDKDNAYYVNLSGENDIDGALGKMIGYNTTNNINTTSSTIKDMVDNWYENNLASYEKYIENSIYCNDRSVSSLGGWTATGAMSSNIAFGTVNKFECANSLDKFAVGSTGNGALSHPIGLITKQEAEYYGLGSSIEYWTMTPSSGDEAKVYGYYVDGSGNLTTASVNTTKNVRPVITIKGDSTIVFGDGTIETPYIIAS